MKSATVRVLVALLVGWSPASSARAAHSTGTLIAQTRGWTPGHVLHLALRIVLDPGWHTYWSNPGDAGLAPDGQVSLDGGKAGPVAFTFPAPRRLPTGGLMGYGYEGAVTLPFVVTPMRTGPGNLAVLMHADWLVCASVCVPESADLTLSLPAEAAPSLSAQAPLFAQADAAMPRAAGPAHLVANLGTDGRLTVSAPFVSPRSVTDAWFVPDQPGVIDQVASQSPRVREGELTLGLRFASPHPPRLVSGVLSLADRSGAETDFAITAEVGGAPATAPARRGFWDLLLLACLGGLVLNLMPCVFLILAMKAFAIVRHGRDDRAGLRRSALLYTAGVVGSFVLFGAAMLGLRALGDVAGWGFQFQSPRFVAVTGWLLFAVGLNLIGAFEVGGRFTGAGQGLVARGGAFGDVMTGVLAVVVATPCTAPFMSVAVAAALAGPPIAGLALFAGLGVGLAFPYLLLGTVPGAARLMPRPGSWMNVVRQALAFPMFAAAAWLAWVLSVETGPKGVFGFAAGMVLIGFAVWVAGVARGRIGATVASASLVLVALLLVDVGRGAQAVASAMPAGIERYDAARLDRLRAEGKPVFVDMSAAWCVSCLVNERVALDTESVKRRFAEAGVVQMRGDWSNQDRSITSFLHRFGREGVPLYVFFPRGNAPAMVLPQVLTPSTVLDTVAG